MHAAWLIKLNLFPLWLAASPWLIRRTRSTATSAVAPWQTEVRLGQRWTCPILAGRRYRPCSTCGRRCGIGPGPWYCVRPGYIPQLELDDGRKFDRCIAPGAAAAGFLIPPAVETTEGLWRWLATGEAPRVRLREES